MWKRLPEAPKTTTGWLRRSRRLKLYADEDIEPELVDHLRARRINIVSVRQLGHHGKPDTFHWAKARKLRRALLTKNGRHFLNDRLFTLHESATVVVLDGDMRNMGPYARAVARLVKSVVPYANVYGGSKIQLSAEEMIVRMREHDGQIRTTRFRDFALGACQWEDAKSSRSSYSD